MSDSKPKLFPRNLTARAGRDVLGNPANSRPESGVDNCYPGLEFDTRLLEQRFFPGLRIEFFQSNGATIVEADLDTFKISPTDFEDEEKIFLWAVFGSINNEPAEYHDCTGTYAAEIWRKIRGLSSGPVAIIAGRGPSIATSDNSLRSALKGIYDKRIDNPKPVVKRDDAGRLLSFMAIDERCRYLDTNGVIDLDVHQPGDLTKTMCAPWMYDFRDCFCYYWASNKPDIVDFEDPETGVDYPVNFLRKDRNTEPPIPDQTQKKGRKEGELDNGDLLEGAWQALPVVLNNRETSASPRSPTVTSLPLNRDGIIERLQYLATVEHALMVQYLFARYSVRADKGNAITNVRSSLLAIAVDEMRHFLTANRVLELFDAKPSTGRAHIIMETPSEVFVGDQAESERLFELRPLNAVTLQDFIDVERPSKSDGSGTDGLYVQILNNILMQRDICREPDVAARLLKLIVDEGHDHYARLLGVQRELRKHDPSEYLFDLQLPTPEHNTLISLCDLYYHAILDAMEVSFDLSGDMKTDLISASIRSMHNFDGVAQMMADQNVAPPFNMPEESVMGAFETQAAQRFHDRKAEHLALSQKFADEANGATEQDFASQQKDAGQAYLKTAAKIVDQSVPNPKK